MFYFWLSELYDIDEKTRRGTLWLDFLLWYSRREIDRMYRYFGN